jgi:CRP-like cAMP-binding protein
MAIADKDSSLYGLSRQNLEVMQTNHPALANAFHQFIARLLADRLSLSSIQSELQPLAITSLNNV